MHKWLLLLLSVPSVLYVGVAVYWLNIGAYPITGDEPHYLMIAESLVRDGDLWVANNYAQNTPVTDALGGPWSAADIRAHSRGFSLHHPALGFLLAPAYAAGGVAGAKLFLALVIGLLVPWLFYAVARSIVPSRAWSVVLALAAALNLPFLAGANQLFTDLLGGVVILHAAYLIVEGFRAKHFSGRALVLLGMETGALAWLHIRFNAPALILLAFAVHGAFTTAPPRRRRRAALPVVTALPFFLLAALYHSIAFQNILGPFGADSLRLEWHQPLMIFMGLHLDPLQGMFMQAPFFLLGWIGIVPFAREARAGALCVLLVYLAALVPNAMHINWYGGSSLAGRYAWAGIGLWLFPLAYAFRLVLARRVGKYVLGAACAASAGLQIVLAGVWLRDGFLANRGVGLPQWAEADVYTLLFHPDLRGHALLPGFRNFEEYLHHAPNLIWVLSCLLLAGVGYALLARRTQMLKGIALALGAVWVALYLLNVPHTEELAWTGAELPASVGSVVETERVGEQGQEGVIAAVPPLPFYRDVTYRVVMDYRTGDKLAGRYFIVLDGGERLEDDRLQVTQGAQATLTLDTPSPADLGGGRNPQTVEVWIYYNGRGELAIQRVSVEPRVSDER